MIWATWRMHRSIFLVSIGVASALAIWLTITGLIEEHAWTIFVSNHCSLNYPGSSPVCSSSYSGRGLFSSINSALCNALPVVLGLVLGAPLVAGEIQGNTNRLAWTQTITRTRWVITKIGVGAFVTAGIMGAMAPLIWWWTNVAERNDRILPFNFDISGFVEVSYALFAFMLGVALGAVIRRIGWTFAAGIPIFVAVRLGERDYIRPGLLPPTSVSVSAYNPGGGVDWVLNSGFLPLGDSAPPPDRRGRAMTRPSRAVRVPGRKRRLTASRTARRRSICTTWSRFNRPAISGRCKLSRALSSWPPRACSSGLRCWRSGDGGLSDSAPTGQRSPAPSGSSLRAPSECPQRNRSRYA